MIKNPWKWIIGVSVYNPLSI